MKDFISAEDRVLTPFDKWLLSKEEQKKEMQAKMVDELVWVGTFIIFIVVAVSVLV